MTCTRRVNQAVVMIAGVVEGDSEVGKYRSHGSVLPIRTRHRATEAYHESAYSSLWKLSNERFAHSAAFATPVLNCRQLLQAA